MSQDVEEKLARAPAKAEAPVDSMLKDMATIILSTFLLIGWVAFIITYPLVKLSPLLLPLTSCQRIQTNSQHVNFCIWISVLACFLKHFIDTPAAQKRPLCT